MKSTTEDGADEGADASDIGHEQHAPEATGPIFLGEDLVVHGEEPARHAGKEAGGRRNGRRAL
jgi:hypothetical protein